MRDDQTGLNRPLCGRDDPIRTLIADDDPACRDLLTTELVSNAVEHARSEAVADDRQHA